MYESSKIFGPDGRHLCNCNRKKANWYIIKGLGEEIPVPEEDKKAIKESVHESLKSAEPIYVKLNFMPNTDHYQSNKLVPSYCVDQEK